MMCAIKCTNNKNSNKVTRTEFYEKIHKQNCNKNSRYSSDDTVNKKRNVLNTEYLAL